MNLNLKAIPTAYSGLALAIASLGLLYEQLWPSGGILQLASALIALVLLGLVLAKFIRYPEALNAEWQQALPASLLSVIPMAVVVVSKALALIVLPAAQILAWLALLGHLALFVGFSWRHLRHLQWQQSLPPWFIPPIGLVLYVVAAPVDFAPWLNGALLYGSLLAYALLLPMVLLRIKQVPVLAPQQPVLTILATPASLILLGFVVADIPKHGWLILPLLLVALLMTFGVYALLPRLLRLPFSPAFAAFTFPLIVSATVLFQLQSYLNEANMLLWLSALLQPLAWLELVIASAVLFWVCLAFVKKQG